MNNLKQVKRQTGASLIELAIVTPVLLLLGLGIVQAGLIFHAKTTLNYATFEAARKGAVTHAQSQPMRDELGLRLGPVFGGTGELRSAMRSLLAARVDVENQRFTKIQIINPTSKTFVDWGILNPENGKIEIPNSHLRQRSRQSDIKLNSGVDLQDANLLKIKTTYGYHLSVPIVGPMLAQIMQTLNSTYADYYRANRIPLHSIATVRMQSSAWESDTADNATDPTDSQAQSTVAEIDDSQAPPMTDSDSIEQIQALCDRHGLNEDMVLIVLPSDVQDQCDDGSFSINQVLDITPMDCATREM